MSDRLFVIGLDCFDPKLCFDWWLDDLPNLRRLTTHGAFGQLASTIPPITVPAWSCMLTGKDPGQQGFYGFRNRADHSYEQMTIASADQVMYPRIWDRVSQAGGEAIVVGVPQTYPIKPINGTMVSGFLTPSTHSAFTHPPELKHEIAELCANAGLGEYMLDVPNFRTDDKIRLLQDIYRMSRQRFALVKHLLQTRSRAASAPGTGVPWSFFMFVDMGPDRIQHGMWKYIDRSHPKYRPGNPYENTIHKYYQFIDTQIGELLHSLPQDVTVVVMSDHGAQAMIGGICINDWLIEQGYLVLDRKPGGVVPIELCEIDWSKTTAWGAGGYYARLFLNVEGREPNGIIPAEQVEAFKGELKAKLEALTDPQGRVLGTHVYFPEEIYSQVNNIPPDLIVYLGNLAWRSVGSIGNETIHVFENDTGPDDANHAQNGLYILQRPDVRGGARADHTWQAIAPTMLEILGLPVPADMSTERLG